MEPQQVVFGQTEAADGRVGFQATVWPTPVVAMEPRDQFGRSLIGVVIGVRIGPFAQRGLDEALGLAIIRYEIFRRLVLRLFPEGSGRYGEPIWDTGCREHEGAGRPPTRAPLGLTRDRPPYFEVRSLAWRFLAMNAIRMRWEILCACIF